MSLSRRSIILALGSMPLLTRGVSSGTTVKARRVGLLSSGAPITDTMLSTRETALATLIHHLNGEVAKSSHLLRAFR